MAALFWHNQIREIVVGHNIGDVKAAIELELRQRQFQDVRRTAQEVAGGRNGVWLSVGHLRIEPTRFWEVVMGAGDSGDITKNTVEEIATALPGIEFA